MKISKSAGGGWLLFWKTLAGKELRHRGGASHLDPFTCAPAPYSSLMVMRPVGGASQSCWCTLGLSLLGPYSPAAEAVMSVLVWDAPYEHSNKDWSSLTTDSASYRTHTERVCVSELRVRSISVNKNRNVSRGLVIFVSWWLDVEMWAWLNVSLWWIIGSVRKVTLKK